MIRARVTAFVRYSAENPELGRLMVREGSRPSWRLTYIVEQLQPRRAEWVAESGGAPLDPHVYYLLIGAGAFVFDVEYECREIFDVDPRSDAFIRKHAAMVADMAIALVESRMNAAEGGTEA